jgi:uncharacterized membrane protein
VKRSTQWLCVSVLGAVALAYFVGWGIWVSRRYAVELDPHAFQHWGALAGVALVLYTLLAGVFALIEARKK